GLTEASPGITQTPRDASVADRSQTVGVVLPELEVKVVDPATGTACVTDERGELHVRGYNVMKGYYNDPAATRAAIDADGWLRTGDEASIDEHCLGCLTGRIKGLNIPGGENLSPQGVEDCLREHPAVADAYVYGLSDTFFGEIVAASVRFREAGSGGALCSESARNAESLTEWCGERLARFKVPKHFRFVTEFPMTASGKIQK